MTIRAPFYPKRGANQVVSPAVASAEITIDPISKSVRLVNSGSNICHVRIGIGTQTATTADLPVRANSEVIVSKGEGEGNVAFISASGTTLHVQPGEGGV
jgi:hypothetical protein